jgi:hypothetical protein
MSGPRVAGRSLDRICRHRMPFSLSLPRAALAQDKCMACHAIGAGAKNKIGPGLNGLDGRRDRLI